MVPERHPSGVIGGNWGYNKRGAISQNRFL